MKAALLLLLLPFAGWAVEGTIANQTTGKPQPNVIVQLIQPGTGGMQTLGTAKSDAQGKFKIDKPTGENPALVQAIYGGVTYTKMLQPGAAATGVEVPVYDSTKQPGTVELNQHVVILQPGAEGIQVNEMYLVRNTGKLTFSDPAKGGIQFYLAPGHGDVKLNAGAPGGMPVQREATPAGLANTFKVDYPIKPGETRFDLTYLVKSSDGRYSGKDLMKSGETRLVVPSGVTLEGDGIVQLGTEPQTQAKIFGVKTGAYSVTVSGSGSLNLDRASPSGGEGGGGAGGGAPEEDTGQPQITQSNPRIYEKLPLVLGLSAAVLVLGFVLLYRSSKA
jgi:hypothetical protein